MGKSVAVQDLLYKTDASLVKQSYDPRYMYDMQNLAGFGLAVWSKQFSMTEKPLLFKSVELPFYDRNLENIASQVKGECMVAHVRGLPYEKDQLGMRNIISRQNLHPFLFDNTNVTLAHNGALSDFNNIKYYLTKEIKKEIFSQIKGTTDTEWLYALFLSRLRTLTPNLNDMIKAVFESIDILRSIRVDHTTFSFSPINLFITDGDRLVATRYVIDYGHYLDNMEHIHLDYHSLWYTVGNAYTEEDGHYEMRGYPQKNSIIISSEPLTIDPSSWIKVPEYSLLAVERNQDTLDIQIFDIDL